MRVWTRAAMAGALGAACLVACTDGAGRRGEVEHGQTELAVGSGVEILDDAPEVAAGEVTDEEVGARTIVPPLPAAKAPAESPRLPGAPLEALTKPIESHFANQFQAQVYIQTDKPLYRPGETIWLRAWPVMRKGQAIGPRTSQAMFELISPKGAVVIRKLVMQQVVGVLTNDFELPVEVPGGEYQLRVTDYGTGAVESKPVMVSAFEAPRIKKKLEFVHKAYGPGDEVSATLEIKRPTGEPLADKALKATVRVDGVDLDPVSFRTNAFGGAVVRFKLPEAIELGDGLLTVMVDDGGIVESISRRVPIVLKKVSVETFPEGGQLVSGLPGRVYFEAKTPLGKPADVAGRVVDDKGLEVATFESYRDGMGRFALTPRAGRRYFMELTAPSGVEGRTELKGIEASGCVLSSVDDLDGELEALRVQVQCSKAQDVAVTAMQQDRLLDAARVKAGPQAPAVVHLKSSDAALSRAQGVARVTLWDAKKNPMAERLVYRNRRKGLKITIEPDAPKYGPRDKVTLKVKTTDATGEPVPASVGLSVVDDTVVSFADDKTGHMLSRLLLEKEIAGKIEDPKFYFDLTEARAAFGLDLVLGTRGWRRFEWRPVLDPPPAPPKVVENVKRPQPRPDMARRRPLPPAPPRDMRPRDMQPGVKAQIDFDEIAIEGALAKPEVEAIEAPRRQEAFAEAPPMEPPMNEPEPVEEEMGGELQKNLAGLGYIEDANKEIAAGPMADDGEKKMEKLREDKEWDGVGGKDMAATWAPVRVFPVPAWEPDYEGPRTDFRDTIFWAPSVQTDATGQAEVSFPMSDAVTSFRVFAEGVGGAAIGRHEEVLTSSLPFSMAVKLPLEVSAGDRLRLPLTLSNERAEPLEVAVEGSFGPELRFAGSPALSLTLPPESRKTLIFPVEVVGDKGQVQARFKARAGTLEDDFARPIRVVPPGFPQAFSKAGQLNGKVTWTVPLGEPIEGSVAATVKFYPSPVATMVSGLDGLLRQPGGCFEQASSTNYPNLMVMRYLKEHNVDRPDLWERSGTLMDSGYKLLTGYESPQKGYEWFGGDPGHEALTAYGLMEFVDMKDVWGQVDGAMIERTAAWLKARRDGKGGFLRNDRALDSFGAASPEVTDAYIVYALTEGGFFKDFQREIEAQAERAQGTSDPYLLALAANSLLNAPGFKPAGQAAVKKLVGLQAKDGAWTGASHSITRSGGENLTIETTSLAIMALLKAGGHSGQVRSAVEWLDAHRSGYGQWAATQATVLALKAMASYASATRKTRNAGSVTIIINGQVARELAYKEGHQDTMAFEGLESFFKAGDNVVEIIHESAEPMPWSLLVEHQSRTPGTSPEATIDLKTELERDAASMGEVVRMTATITNTTDKGQPMTLARVGLPGGLSFQLWQLKELREKGLIGFFETRPREVIIYLRDMRPNQVVTVPLDLVATVPGQYEAPASSAYLYYTDEHKTWRPGLTMTVR